MNINIVNGVMATVMAAYAGSGFSEHLIPTNLSRRGEAPWWMVKRRGGRALHHSNKSGTFYRSGKRNH